MSLKDDLLQAVAEAGLDEGALDELVHDCKSSEAADINNSGFDGQIEYLIESGMTEKDIREAIAKAKEEGCT